MLVLGILLSLLAFGTAIDTPCGKIGGVKPEEIHYDADSNTLSCLSTSNFSLMAVNTTFGATPSLYCNVSSSSWELIKPKTERSESDVYGAGPEVVKVNHVGSINVTCLEYCKTVLESNNDAEVIIEKKVIKSRYTDLLHGNYTKITTNCTQTRTGKDEMYRYYQCSFYSTGWSVQADNDDFWKKDYPHSQVYRTDYASCRTYSDEPVKVNVITKEELMMVNDFNFDDLMVPLVHNCISTIKFIQRFLFNEHDMRYRNLTGAIVKQCHYLNAVRLKLRIEYENLIEFAKSRTNYMELPGGIGLNNYTEKMSHVNETCEFLTSIDNFSSYLNSTKEGVANVYDENSDSFKCDELPVLLKKQAILDIQKNLQKREFDYNQKNGAIKATGTHQYNFGSKKEYNL